jgi:hypothetical protein
MAQARLLPGFQGHPVATHLGEVIDGFGRLTWRRLTARRTANYLAEFDEIDFAEIHHGIDECRGHTSDGFDN